MPTVPIPADLVGSTEDLHRHLDDLERSIVIDAVTHGDLIRDGLDRQVARRGDLFVAHADQWHAIHAELHRRYIASSLRWEPFPIRAVAA